MRRRLQIVAVIWAFIVIFDIRFTLALKAQYEEPHIYEFSSEISTGVEKPARFTSKFAINGLMTIQRKVNDPKWENVYFITLKNVQHSSYYGPTIEGNKFEPIQRDSLDLEKPFLAIYDEHGKIQGLKIQNGEKSWTKSIKKSIASMLQFDWPKTLDLIKKSTDDDVYTVENTVHGKCSVLYHATQQNGVPGKIGRDKLIKSYNPNECSNSIRNVEGYEIQYRYPIKTIKDQMSSNVDTIFEFDIASDGPIIKKMLNNEKYTWVLDGLDTINYNSNAFKHSQPKFVEISHILTFNDTVKSNDFNKFDETMFSKVDSQLVFENEEMIEDYSEASVEENIENIKNLLTEAVDYLKTNRLENMKVVGEPRQFYNKIQVALGHLSIEQLEHLYDEIGGKDDSETNLIRDTLIQIIPFAGTKASFIFSKNLIMTRKIVDNNAVRVLDQMSTYVRQPTNELLLEMRALIENNNGLPIDVFETATLSYSHLLRRISTSQNGSEELMKQSLKYFNDALNDAESIDTKLVFMTALANTGSHDALEYLLPLLKKDQAPLMDRLRYGVIRLLTRLIDEDDSFVLELLERILLDESEPRHMRLAAYDVLFARANIDEEDAGAMDRVMAGDEHLRNYHQSTLHMLKQLGVLPGPWKRYAKEDFETATLLSFNAIVKVPNEVFDSFFGEVSQAGLVKVSVVMQQGLPVVSYAMVDISSGRLVELDGGYINLHLTDNIETNDKHFFDWWMIKADRITFNHIDASSSDLNNSSPLDFLIRLKKRISRIVIFNYKRLTSFSMPTGFGIPIVFQHKSPYFISGNCDSRIKMDGTTIAINLNISMDISEQAYSDSLFYNPFTKSMHSTKKYDMTEVHVPFSLSITYDFLSKRLKIELPIILKNQNSNRGLVSYTTSGVMITRDDDQTSNSGQFCGFQQVKLKDPNLYFNANDVQEYDTFGLKMTRSVYDCELSESSIARLLRRQLFNDVKSLKINQCGNAIIIGPNTLGSVSQIELMIRADVHSSESEEKAWYFLPMIELHFKSALALRHSNNSIVTIGSYNLDFVSSQGHFTNEINTTLSAKTHRSDYLNVCYKMRQSYPVVLDTLLPSLDDTRNLRINAIHRLTFGYAFDDNCSDNLVSLELKHTSQLTPKQVEDLEQRASDSKCAKQKSNPHIVYPLGSSPLTIDCIDEFINNSTLRNYVFNLTYDKISAYPIELVRMVMERANSVAETLKAEYPGVEIKMISPQSKAFQGNMVYEVNFPVIDMETKPLGRICLDNTFFSFDFLRKIKNGKISVTNVFPKFTISSNGMSKQLTDFDDWKRIRTNMKDCEILIKSAGSDKLSVKIVCGHNELRFEPIEITQKTKKVLKEDVSFEPAVYFNNELVGSSPVREFLPLRKANREDDHIFSLLMVEPYIMGRPMNMPLSVYYSINSVTVIEEIEE